jgi:hypothetical protein
MRDGWSNLPLSSVATRVTTKNKKLIDEVFTVSAEHGLIEQEKFFNKRVASKNLLGYTVVQPGMLVYNKSYSANAAFGVITRNHHDYSGVVSPLYIVFEPNEDKVLGTYLELAANSSLFFSSLQKFIKEGGRAHGGITVSLGDFFDCEIPIPSLPEQKRILDLLSSVDAYIDALKQQSDMARTARSAVAENAINSGYLTTELSKIGRIVTGSTPSTKRTEYWEPAEVDFITPGDFGQQLLICDASRMVSRVGADVARGLRIHSVMQVCIGATIGKVGYVSHEVVTNQQINSLVGLDELDAYFVALMLSTNEMQTNIRDWAGTTTLPIISKSAWGKLSIPWPDGLVRESISVLAKSMDEFVLEIDNAVVAAKNLRTGLLSDLLSGIHEIPESYDKFLEMV